MTAAHLEDGGRDVWHLLLLALHLIRQADEPLAAAPRRCGLHEGEGAAAGKRLTVADEQKLSAQRAWDRMWANMRQPGTVPENRTPNTVC